MRRTDVQYAYLCSIDKEEAYETIDKDNGSGIWHNDYDGSGAAYLFGHGLRAL